MSIQYGWTYARRPSDSVAPSGKRSPKRNRYRKGWRAGAHTLAVSATAVRRGARRARPARSRAAVDYKALEKAGRVLVALGLIAVTVMVLGKQSAWMERVSSWLPAWRPSFSLAWPARPRAAAPAERPTVRAAKPSESRGEAGALSVVRTDQNLDRKPVALLSDSALFYLNAGGQVWPVDPQSAPEDLPVITGATVREVPDAMGIGLKTELNMPLVRRLLASRMADEFSEIHLEPQGGATLYTREGVKVLLSGNGRTGRDLRRMEAVMRDVGRRGQRVSMIDLRYDQHVVVRPASLVGMRVESRK